MQTGNICIYAQNVKNRGQPLVFLNLTLLEYFKAHFHQATNVAQDAYPVNTRFHRGIIFQKIPGIFLSGNFVYFSMTTLHDSSAEFTIKVGPVCITLCRRIIHLVAVQLSTSVIILLQQ